MIIPTSFSLVSKRTLLSSAIVLAVAGGSNQAIAQNSDSGPALEEVTVTGVRASLRDALNTKRGADNFSDVIKAEDIGELPDANLAESLQRITGVQIVRDVGASREQLDGQPVNIRGLPSLATINGRTMLSGQDSRNFDFRTLASEAFGELVISKTPTADQIEGGLGGTIELKTRKPEEFKGQEISFTANLVQLDYADTTNPNYSGLYANSFLDDRLGVVVSGSYEQIDQRTDAFTSRGGWEFRSGYAGSGFDLNGDGDASDALVPRDLRYWYQAEERERIGFDTVVTFAATEELDVTFNYNYSRFDRDFFNGILALGTGQFTAGNAVAGTTVFDPSGGIVAGEFNNMRVQADGRLSVDDVEAKNYGLNFNWKRDNLGINFDIGRAEGGSEGRQLINRYRMLSSANLAYDFRGSDVPTVSINGGATDVTDRSLYRVDLAFNDPERFDNTEDMLRLDVDYEFDGAISRVAAGVRTTETNYKRRAFNQTNRVGGSLSRNPGVSVLDVDGNPVSFIPASDASFDGLLGQGFPVGDFLSDVNGNIPRAWLYAQYPGGSLDGPGPVYDSVFGLTALGQTENTRNRTDIVEETTAFYVRADVDTELGGIPVSGNFGVRLVDTDIDSTARIDNPGGFEFGTESNSYSDVLPSLNLAAEFSENVVGRFALGRVMRRPDIDLLRPSLQINNSALTGNQGNVQLDPFRADQLDAAVEWYFAEEGLLSFTFFMKDVDNFTSTQVTDVLIEEPGLVGGGNSAIYSVSTPVNAGSADIQGYEISYQQTFDSLPGLLSNMGAIVNYTYTDAETDTGEAFPELSENVYNFILFYDNGTFDARLAYNRRSEYRSDGDGNNRASAVGIDEFVAENGQLDFSTNYAINDNFDVLFEVLNVNNEDFQRYTGSSALVRDYRSAERRFTLGVRGKF